MTDYLGIDIGGTKIAGAIVTKGGIVRRRVDVVTPAQEGGPAVLAAALALAQTLCDGEQVEGIGIGAGGQIDPLRGIVLSATDLLPGWAGTQIAPAFADALRVPAFADNDVNALALGEARLGAARGLSTVVFLAIGTGLGGALLINGMLHHGAHGGGGEFGHLLVSMDADARHDAGGHLGTWEAYVSGPGLARTYQEIVGEHAPVLTGHAIARAAREAPGGAAAQAIMRTGKYLGYGLVSLANALDPDLIVVGGGLAALGDALLGPARDVLRLRALPHAAQCPLAVASLGDDANVIGAASLAMLAPLL